jgi:hypothetical protein
MSWSEIKKAINTDLTTPLNTLIKNQISSLSNTLTSKLTTLQTTANNANTNAQNAYNIVNNSKYGNSAINSKLDSNFNAANVPAGYEILSIQSSSATITGKGAIIGVDSYLNTNVFKYCYVTLDDGIQMMLARVVNEYSTNTSQRTYEHQIINLVLPLYFLNKCVIKGNSNLDSSNQIIVYYVLL